MKKEICMKRFVTRIKKMPTIDLTGLIGVIGLLFFFGTFLFRDSSLFTRSVLLKAVGVALSFYIWGCIGLVYIIRCEAPVLPLGHAVKGRMAVLIGIIILLLTLSSGTLFLSSIWR
jgi:hypothetical protein